MRLLYRLLIYSCAHALRPCGTRQRFIKDMATAQVAQQLLTTRHHELCNQPHTSNWVHIVAALQRAEPPKAESSCQKRRNPLSVDSRSDRHQEDSQKTLGNAGGMQPQDQSRARIQLQAVNPAHEPCRDLRRPTTNGMTQQHAAHKPT